MKVRMTVTVTVDVEKWAAEFHLDSEEVREDVRMYMRSQITEDQTLIECCDRVVIR